MTHNVKRMVFFGVLAVCSAMRSSAADVAKPSTGAVAKVTDKAAEKARLDAERAAKKEAERKAAEEDKARRQATIDAVTAFEHAEIDRAAAERASEKAIQAAAKVAGALSDAKRDAEKLKAKSSATETQRSQAEARVAKAKEAADRAASEQSAAEKTLREKSTAADRLLVKANELRAVAYGGLTPLPADQWNYAKARHLAVRAGFGATPDEVAVLHRMGLHRAVDFLVDFQKQPAYANAYQGSRPERGHPDDVLRTPEERRRLNQLRMSEDYRDIARLREWWMQRMIASPRPLEEKLTLFWSNHFAVEHRTVREAQAIYQLNQLERDHAAGSFAALLHGIINDPAMLRYLDNNRNVKGHPNENLAREIMELFSMGEGRGYTENDIMEAARSLTGYTYDNGLVQFRYKHSVHDDEPKTIFGSKGNYTGDDLAELILKQPTTAQFVAGKLFAFFAYQQPDVQTVERSASVLRRSNYELSPMLKNLFLSQEFYSDRSVGTQIKSPVQMVVGSLRDLGIKEIDYGQLTSACRSMEQDLFDPPNVKGWEEGRAWVNSNRLFVRYNAAADLVERTRIGGGSYGLDLVTALKDVKADDPAAVVDHLIGRIFVRPLSKAKRQQLIEFAASLPPKSLWTEKASEVNVRLRALLVLMLTLPEYQLT